MDYSEIVGRIEQVRSDNLSVAQDFVMGGEVVISESKMLENIKPLDDVLDQLSNLNACSLS